MSDNSAIKFFYEETASGYIENLNFDPTVLPVLKTFLDILLYYSVVDEQLFFNESKRTNKKRAEFGLTTEDLEFKKLIWIGVLTAVQSGDPTLIEIVGNSPFLRSLLLYIDPLANSYAVNRWSSPQLRELQLHCLGILANIIPYLKT